MCNLKETNHKENSDLTNWPPEHSLIRANTGVTEPVLSSLKIGQYNS